MKRQYGKQYRNNIAASYSERKVILTFVEEPYLKWSFNFTWLLVLKYHSQLNSHCFLFFLFAI